MRLSTLETRRFGARQRKLCRLWLWKSRTRIGKLTGPPTKLKIALIGPSLNGEQSIKSRETTNVRNNTRSGIIESNKAYGVLDNVSSSVIAVPVRPVFVFWVMLNGFAVNVLKDEECNTNVISSNFLRRNKDTTSKSKANISISHSWQDNLDKSSEIVLDGTLSIGLHSYKSNWIVAKCRYDVLLGMPWHVTNNLSIDYTGWVVRVKKVISAMRVANMVPTITCAKIQTWVQSRFGKHYESDYQKQSSCSKAYSRIDLTALEKWGKGRTT